MKINSLLKKIFTYLFIFVLFTLIFILFFHTPLFIGQKVLFYRGVELLAVTSIIVCIIMTLINRIWINLYWESLIAAISISISINMCFFLLFPITIDRSISMYLLTTLRDKDIDQGRIGISEKKLEEYFIEDYVNNKQAVKRRIFEQSIINMIKEQDGYVKLTNNGKVFMQFLQVIKIIYAIN